MVLHSETLNPTCSSCIFKRFTTEGWISGNFHWGSDSLKSCKSPRNDSSLFTSHAQCRQQQLQQSFSPGTANKLNLELESPCSGEVKGNSISELNVFWLPWKTRVPTVQSYDDDDDVMRTQGSLRPPSARDMHGGLQDQQSHGVGDMGSAVGLCYSYPYCTWMPWTASR